MTEFTKERLISEIEMLEHFAGNVKWISEKGEQSLLFAADAMRQLLDSMEQEPAAYMVGDYSLLHAQNPKVDEYLDRAKPLYAAPQLPQPAVPDELAGKSFEYIANKFQVSMSEAQWILVGWNASRAAMLQGARRDLSYPVDPQVAEYERIMEQAVPDGWVAVPVEPTEDMVIAGFEAELREEFRNPEAWEAFESMSGCEQAAHRAKLCWAAMIAAVPQQETKI